MATLLARLGSAAYRRWPIVIAVWLAAFLAVGAVAATQSKPMTDSFTIPGIPSEEAADLQQELFPQAQGSFNQATVNVVVAAPEGEKLSSPENTRRVEQLIAGLEELPQMPADPQLVNPAQAGPTQTRQMVQQATAQGTPEAQARANARAVSPLSENGRVGIISFAFDVEAPTEVEPATQEEVTQLLADVSGDGFVAEANGQGMQAIAPPGGSAELIGVGIALLVLLLTFGSVVAAGLPIVTALFGVGLAVTGITAMTAVMEIGSTTPMLATMIGLAVGIDYALFILARYRTELHDSGDRVHAVGRAVGTAGSAVVFAGLTVLIALAALSVVQIPFLTAMGIAAAAAVLVAVLVALTLIPAVLGMLKGRSFGLTFRRYRPRRDDQGLVLNNGVRWARTVGRAPVAAIAIVVVGLGALAIPMKDLYLAFPTDSTAPTDTTQRQASDLISQAFGPGREAPLLVVVDGRAVEDPQQRQQAFGEVTRWASQQDGVANAQVVLTNARGQQPATGAQVMVTPSAGPSDEQTKQLLDTLRSEEERLEQQTGATLGITGLTAITTDVSDRLNDALPVYLAVVIGLAFLLLMLVFRSVVVPLTATLGFLLSVLATLGVTVAVFQQGALGLMEGQPIVSFMPIFLIGLVFGLAMDYQVFLVTRVREAWAHGASPYEAVVDGFRNSARVVSAAAVIMTSVFAAFVFEDEPIITMMGFALASAVVLDAFVVRMVLVPALMYVLGEKAWWLPRWLDRLLPHLDIEGEALTRSHTRSTPQREPATV